MCVKESHQSVCRAILMHHLAAAYSIIMSGTLKLMGNHVMCDHGA